MSRQSDGSALMGNQHSFSEGLNDGWAGREAAFPESGDYMRGWQKGHSGLIQSSQREQQILLASHSPQATRV